MSVSIEEGVGKSAVEERPKETAQRLIRELSVVIPAYNEEAVLPEVLKEAFAVLSELCERWELIVVDDGSTDRTSELLREIAIREMRLQPLVQPRNLGYSQALIRGFAASRMEAIFYTDADAQFDLREIVRLYPLLEEVPLVTGYRIGRQDPPLRHLTSAVYNRLQSWLLGVRVRDVNCAFKLFHRSFFEKVRLGSGGFLIDAEIYARASRAGLAWRQVGVSHHPRRKGSSSIRPSTVGETLWELWCLRRRLAA